MKTNKMRRLNALFDLFDYWNRLTRHLVQFSGQSIFKFFFDMIFEMDDKQFEKWYHQTSDLYIFGNGELTKLIYK